MSKQKNFYTIGQEIGHLTLIDSLEERIGNRVKLTWVCQCLCSSIIKIGQADLSRKFRAKHKVSCGCRAKMGSFIQDRQKGAMISKIQRYADTARRRGYKYGLTYEESSALFSQNCSYCKLPPDSKLASSIGPKRRSTFPDEILNMKVCGIDRIDNSKDYTTDNCVSCCTICNRAKNDSSVEDFQGWIERIRKIKHL